MRFLLAPDKLKGSLSATAAAECIAAGIRAVIPDAQIDLCPIADGGEGTVDAVLKAAGGRLITRRVTGPLPEMKVDAGFALLDDMTAVIEMSAASGLALLKIEDRDPLNTTTFGTGELITAAVREGAKKIVIGLGGSATVDAGIGMAQACGFTILMRDGEPVSATEPLCGRDLSNVLMVKHGRGEITNGIEVLGLADVTNPLCGPLGAAKVFGPQKGASGAVVEQLDFELKNLAKRTGKQIQADYPGAGAAGGLGFGILAFFNGRIAGGFDHLAEVVQLRQRLNGVDFCITAEGRLDSQSAHGKAVAGVASLCLSENIPCIALAGSIERSASSLPGLTAQFSICDGPISLDDAVLNVDGLLTAVTRNCIRLWHARK